MLLKIWLVLIKICFLGKTDLPNTCYAASDKGWMTCQIFQEWFQKFCAQVRERPLLVILDGHVTHLDKSTIEMAVQENITLLKLPAHTTDLLQPLDRCCFGPLKFKWNEALINWQRLNQRKPSRSEFSDLICSIWNEGLSAEIIKSSFEKVGIFPCDKNRYPEDRLDPAKLLRYKEHGVFENSLDIFEDCDEETPLPQTEQFIESVPDQSNSASSKPSSSFESLLLEKIRRTPNITARRRKIDSMAKVLTTEEYLKEIQDKEQNKKSHKGVKSTKSKKKQKASKTVVESDSESSNNEQPVYQDESDVEGLTLENIIEDECDDNQSENRETNHEITEAYELRENDFILTKFNTKKTQVYYVAQILKVFESDVEVKYLRRKGFKFIFPAIEEKYFIDKSDIEMKLPQPEIESKTCRISQQYWFPIDFEKYVVQ